MLLPDYRDGGATLSTLPACHLFDAALKRWRNPVHSACMPSFWLRNRAVEVHRTPYPGQCHSPVRGPSLPGSLPRSIGAPSEDSQSSRDSSRDSSRSADSPALQPAARAGAKQAGRLGRENERLRKQLQVGAASKYGL